VFLIGHAVGVQIYSCNGSVWSSAMPRANLLDDHDKLIIAHFAGPTWQAKDGSMVVGHAEASVTVDDTAIPWVRLSAASSTPGRLGNNTNIQRIANTGGLAPPAADCNATTAGTVAEVPHCRLLLEVDGPDTTHFAENRSSRAGYEQTQRERDSGTAKLSWPEP
jgi:Protein of unknown function (DUF3455)